MIIRIPLNTTHGVLSLILHYKGHPTNRFCPQKPPFTSGRQRVNPLLFRLYHIWLVVSAPLKNMKVNGKDYPIYYVK